MYLHPIEDYERQLELEKEAIDMGRKKYLENKENDSHCKFIEDEYNISDNESVDDY